MGQVQKITGQKALDAYLARGKTEKRTGPRVIFPSLTYL